MFDSLGSPGDAVIGENGRGEAMGEPFVQKGISRDDVIDAAAKLTAEVGLVSWSMRDLARRLEVASTAIYHHVGRREEVLAAVAARVVTEVPRADSQLDWRAWFEQTLLALCQTLRRYPGVAHWFMMHGPTMPEALDIVDAGVGCLRRAGFGEDAAFAYSLLFNHGVGSIAFSQDRQAINAPDGPRQLEVLHADFTRLSAASAGIAHLATSVLADLAGSPEGEEALLSRSLRVLMRGLEAEFLQDPDSGQGR